MMFLCSVASELSNYDSCQSVHFSVLIQLSFCLKIRDNPWVGQTEMQVCKVGKKFMGA